MAKHGCDCLIVGAGPAGCRLALALAQQGLSVVLLDHGRPSYSGPIESIISWTSVGWLGAGPRVVEAALPQHHVLRRGSIWGSDEVRWRDELLLGGLVQRGEFDRRLRQQCLKAGVDVWLPASLLEVGEHGQCRLRCGARERLVTARTVVCATGRARHSPPLPPPVPIGPPLLALTLQGTVAATDRGTMMVEAVADGWTWTTAMEDGAASVLVMVEPALLAGRANGSSAPSRQAIAQLLAGCRGPAARVTDWSVVAANDATPRCRPAHASVFALGDAAATVDPMASQGVEKALHMADGMAALIAPAIAHPDWLSQLCSGHAEREAGLARSCQQRALEFYRGETRWPDRPFWRARHVVEPEPVPPPLPNGPLVVTASARAATVVTVGPRGCQAQPGWLDEASGRRLCQVNGLPLSDLLALFRSPRALSDAVVAAASIPALFIASPAQVQTALRSLCADGWLIPLHGAATRR